MNNKAAKTAIKIALAFLILCVLLVCLIPEAHDYIYGYFLFRRIGSNLTVNIKDDLDKAIMVAFWVFDNIKFYGPWLPVIDDNFLNIYKRGFGFCDQSAHLYATMMYWLGFETKLLKLRREDGVTTHTVAVVKIKEKFMVVDTLYKFIFVDYYDRKPIGIEELENSELFNKYVETVNAMRASLKVKPLQIKPQWFINGSYYKTFPYAGRRYLFKKVLQKIKQRITAVLN